jgi:hypothetical protein
MLKLKIYNTCGEWERYDFATKASADAFVWEYCQRGGYAGRAILLRGRRIIARYI